MSECLQRLQQGPNPFESKIVDTPWADIAGLDVESIHARQTQRVLDLFREVQEKGEMRNALLLAPAGTGKTHLLARLRRRIADDGLFVHVDPYFDPARIAHSILRNVMESLLQTAPGVLYKQLTRLCFDAVRAILQDVAQQGGRETSQEAKSLLTLLGGEPMRLFAAVSDPRMGKAARRLVNAWLRDREPRADAEYVDVLLQCFTRSTSGDRTINRLAERWVKGDEVAEEDLRELGVPANLDSEERAIRALATLGLLSKWHRPFLLTFDQLETARPEDGVDPRVELGKVLTGIRGSVPNILVLISMLPDTWQEISRAGGMPTSVAERLTACTLQLRSATAEEVREVIRVRIALLCADRKEADGWPFAESFTEDLAKRGVSIREVLRQCGEMLEENLGRTPPPWGGAAPPQRPAPTPQSLVDRHRERTLNAIPPDLSADLDNEDAVLQVVVDLLKVHLDGRGKEATDRWKLAPVRKGAKRYFTLADGSTGRVLIFGVSATTHGRGFHGRVSVLQELAKERNATEAILIRPADHRDYKPGPKSEEIVSALQAAGGGLFFLETETYRQLLAARKLLAAVDSAEVQEGSLTVTRKELVPMFGTRGHLEGNALLQRLLGEGGATATPAPASSVDRDPELKRLVEAERIVGARKAAERLGCPFQEVMAAAHGLREAGCLRIYGGEDPVLAWVPTRRS